LSTEELLALILSKGVKGYNFRTLSRMVFASLRHSVSQGLNPYGEPISIKGVGKVKAMQVVAGIELGARLYNLEKDKCTRVFNSEQAWNLLNYIGKFKQERLVALLLNGRYELIKKQTISIGQLGKISIQPREVLVPALQNNSCYVLIAHNHPSGDHIPSKEDIDFTITLKECLDMVGIYLLDHLVISGNGWSRVDI